MSGGGKGGSSTTQVKVPAWLESAARQDLARADQLAQIGYTPYYGPDVAAFSPMQQAAFEGTNQAAAAFGMPTAQGAGMPAPQTFAGGVQGYSSAPLYQQSLDALRAEAPGQYAALTAPFINPVTGAAPAAPFGTSGAQITPNTPTSAALIGAMSGGGGGGGVPVRTGTSGGGKGGTTSINTPMSYLPGGVNTANPSSTINRVAAALSGPQGAPTSSSRPVARPTTTTATSGGK
jgi:hypothetical protein